MKQYQDLNASKSRSFVLVQLKSTIFLYPSVIEREAFIFALDCIIFLTTYKSVPLRVNKNLHKHFYSNNVDHHANHDHFMQQLKMLTG